MSAGKRALRIRVLIAAADIRTAAGIRAILEKENLSCDAVGPGKDGLQMALAYDYDIIILDLTLADIQAYRMLHRLRAAPVRTPLLILSARDELDRNIKPRGLGADEFLAKPFGSRELSARVRAIMRRSKAHRSTVRTGKLMVNLATGGVSVNGQPVRLTLKEYCILELLSLRKGTVLKKAVFLDHLYGETNKPSAKIIDAYISTLRSKLARATGGSHYIETVRGHGYMLREPVLTIKRRRSGKTASPDRFAQ